MSEIELVVKAFIALIVVAVILIICDRDEDKWNDDDWHNEQNV